MKDNPANSHWRQSHIKLVVGLDSLVCLYIFYHEHVEFILIKGYTIDSDFDVFIERIDTMTIDDVLVTSPIIQVWMLYAVAILKIDVLK